MQNAQRYRRGVLMPLDDRALDALVHNDVDDETNVAHIEITDDDSFYEIWRSGVFHRINEALGCCIDDYEEEWIPSGSLATVAAVAQSTVNGGVSQRVADFLSRLIRICARAEREKRPLLFVL